MSQKTSIYKWLGILLAYWTLTGCNAILPPPPTLSPGTLPDTYAIYDAGPGPSDHWWEDLDNPELNELITTALTSNWDLKSARSRLTAVRAGVLQVTAQQYPGVDGRATLDIGRIGTNGNSTPVDQLGLRLTASYEMDLWGRVQADVQNAQLLAEAQDQAVRAATMTLAAEIANRWVGIIAQKVERRLLDQQRQASRTLLELIELRFHNAMASALDIYQQRRSLAQVEALIPLSEMREQTLRHDLATLLGQPGTAEFDIQTDQLPELQAIPNAGLPADLLAKRPDIRQVGYQLQAAQWGIAEARANRLPRLELSTVAALTDLNLVRLLDGWLATLGALLAGPVFDGGQGQAAVTAAEAETQQQLDRYHQVVLTALREVQDAIVRETKQRQHLKALATELDIARKGLREAQFRYANGLTDYLPVLTELTAQQRLERQMVLMQAQLIQYRVSLYRALGGHWMTSSKGL